MSTRKLGGGRVLGGGRSLSANVATLTQRNTSFLSPTASSVSVNSSRSTSQQSLDPQDLSSRVSLEQSDDNNAAAIAAATSLVCPICNEETVSSVWNALMLHINRLQVTLLQLNRWCPWDGLSFRLLTNDQTPWWQPQKSWGVQAGWGQSLVQGPDGQGKAFSAFGGP